MIRAAIFVTCLARFPLISLVSSAVLGCTNAIFATPVGLRPPFVAHPATLPHPDRRPLLILFAAQQQLAPAALPIPVWLPLPVLQHRAEVREITSSPSGPQARALWQLLSLFRPEAFQPALGLHLAEIAGALVPYARLGRITSCGARSGPIKKGRIESGAHS